LYNFLKYHFNFNFLAITTLQHVIATDFKATDIEVAIACRDEGFRPLTEKEIEDILTTIAERE
jgi:20S proteasome subunit alpha 1